MDALTLPTRKGNMRDAREIEAAMKRHGDEVWRACCVYFRASADAEDAYQETFLRFARAESAAFDGDEHVKAWLLRVCANVCKDMLKAASRRNVPLSSEDGMAEYPSIDGQLEPGLRLFMVMDAMNRLDDPPKTPLYLALCQGYTAPEIAEMLQAPVNTVYSWIARGKKTLREALE